MGIYSANYSKWRTEGGGDVAAAPWSDREFLGVVFALIFVSFLS